MRKADRVLAGWLSLVILVVQKPSMTLPKSAVVVSETFIFLGGLMNYFNIPCLKFWGYIYLRFFIFRHCLD